MARVLGASYEFFLSNIAAILRAVWIPLAVAAALLAALFKAYFSMLAIYLDQPNARIASLTLGIAIALMFVWVFLYVDAAARLALLVHRGRASDGAPPAKRAVAARLYAATLRLILVLVVLLGAEIGIVALVAQSVPASYVTALAWLGWSGAALVCAVLSVRCGMLQPALALYERRGMLRRAWKITSGRTGPFLLLWLALSVLPVALLQSLGEFAIRPLQSGALTGLSVVEAAQALAANNWAIVAIAAAVAISSSVALVLTTIGSCLAYEALKGADLPKSTN